MTSLAQMRNRMNAGHRAALARLAAGLPPFPVLWTAGEIKGARTVLCTLIRWGAIDADGNLTAVGRALTGGGEVALSSPSVS